MHLAAHLPVPDPAREDALFRRGWNRLEEPAGIPAALLASSPYMLFTAGSTLALAAFFVPVSADYFGLGGGSFSVTIGLPAVLSVIAVLVLHELVHLACIPREARAGRTTVGISAAGAFVVCEEELERNRYLLVSLAPFLCISVGGTLALGMLSLLTPLALTVLTLNALGSSVDILGAAGVYRRVPARAVMTAVGMNTYWQERSVKAQ